MNLAEKALAEGILFTDQYQLTMAQLYFRMGYHEKLVQFDHYFRNYPDYGTHKAGYCVNAGLEWLLNWMFQSRFGITEINYLKTQRTRSGKPLFEADFLDWLYRYGNFEGITLYAIPEGRVVHPNVPITVVQGPLAMAQILETSLLNHLNYQILIATKAARIHEIGRGQVVLEFGLRRGQHVGANAGARAALIGGAMFTSNVGVSALLGLPPKGTHAHSMVQLFIALGMSELDAFRAYADVYPDDCLLLVDTIDTLESGIPNAIKVFEELRQKGHKPLGIRLDSGDLAFLSIQAAKMLDEAGFEDVSIVLSNNLDEMVIWQIITQIVEEAPRYGVDADRLIRRLVYGVGTRLITSWGEPALGGVYKLVAVYDQNEWKPAIKISESLEKTPNPGNKKVWRIYDKRGKATADLIALSDEDPRQKASLTLRHPTDHTKYRSLHRDEISEIEPLLETILENGKLVTSLPTLEEIRAKREKDVERLDPGVRRLMYPHIYHVSLTQKLWNLKQELIAQSQPRLENNTLNGNSHL
ncbi:MAG: Nicotinate phosphoribosyltransferase [Anaerolineae bacterium]|jgi:nicotinate phosphoribosyltransferase|nr:MAG: Nicotinate phosphoribosyltransferase [Anaerolineae bacterium]